MITTAKINFPAPQKIVSATPIKSMPEPVKNNRNMFLEIVVVNPVESMRKPFKNKMPVQELYDRFSMVSRVPLYSNHRNQYRTNAEGFVEWVLTHRGR